MQIRPGRAKSTFVNRCAKAIDRCVIEELADDVFICGQPVCAILEDETEKFEGFTVGDEGRTITLSWLKDHMPNVRAGDPVTHNGQTYKIKNGYPIDTQDCWLMAELDNCETCQ